MHALAAQADLVLLVQLAIIAACGIVIIVGTITAYLAYQALSTWPDDASGPKYGQLSSSQEQDVEDDVAAAGAS